MKSRIAGPVAFAGAAAGAVASAALSYWNERPGFYAALGWSALVIAQTPMVGWTLMIFVAPFQSLFAIGSEDFLRMRAILVLILMVRLWSLLARRSTYQSPMVWILLGFAVLVGAHDVLSGSRVRQLAWDTGLFVELAAIYIISREFGAEARGMTLAQIAIVAAAFTSAVVSFMFLYLPLPGLIAFHPRLDNLRLFGVQDGPNELAKLLLPSLLLLVCVVVDRPRGGRWAIPMVIATGFLLAATGTRTVLGAAAGALFLVRPPLPPLRARTLLTWGVLIIALLGTLTWTVAAPWVERHAARQWIARNGQSSLCFYLRVHPSDPDRCNQQVAASAELGASALERIRAAAIRDLRLQGSYLMTRTGGRTAYEPRAFSPLQMGQRDRTWAAGLQIVARHWLWGIGGNAQWAKSMQQVTGYPFSSPHNGLLEISGGYGIIGLFLYLSIMTLFIRNYLGLKASAREPWQRLANEWTFLCGVAVFIVEMTDVLIVLAFSIHAIWFWVIAGLQAGLRDAVGSISPRPATPSAQADGAVLQT